MNACGSGSSPIRKRFCFVIPLGFEPKTHSLEGCCSIQLSYGTIGSQRDRRTACGCKYTKSRPIINEFARNYTNRMQIEPRTEGGSQGSDDIPGPSVGDRTPPSPARRMVTGRRPHVPQTGPSEGSAPGKTYRTKKRDPGVRHKPHSGVSCVNRSVRTSGGLRRTAVC